MRFIQLGEAGSGIHQDVHYGDVSLEGRGVKPRKLDLAEHRPCNQEIGSCAPVPLDVEGCGKIFLTTFDLECNPSAETPVLGLHEFLITLHLAADPDTEFLQHIHRYEHVGDALGIVDMDGRIALE